MAVITQVIIVFKNASPVELLSDDCQSALILSSTTFTSKLLCLSNRILTSSQEFVYKFHFLLSIDFLLYIFHVFFYSCLTLLLLDLLLLCSHLSQHTLLMYILWPLLLKMERLSILLIFWQFKTYRFQLGL